MCVSMHLFTYLSWILLWREHTFPLARLHTVTWLLDLHIDTCQQTHIISNVVLHIALLFRPYHAQNCLCTCCVVFVVVYDIRYGDEGVSFSQEELSSVTCFNLVMPNIAVTTAQTKTNKKLKPLSVYRLPLDVYVNFIPPTFRSHVVTGITLLS